MNGIQREILKLEEYAPVALSGDSLTEEMGRSLWQDYAKQVSVEVPSFQNNNQWRLTSQGWVGFIPLASELGIELAPKVPIENLFRMLEYAYQIELKTIDGWMHCRSLEEFYNRLANILARRVLDRARKGFYRTYIRHSKHLPYLRGRLRLNKSLREPWSVDLSCRFENHTADVEENQILAFTLLGITRSGACSEQVLPNVRKAFRALQGVADLKPVLPSRCYEIIYNRLNDDYQPLHALCRFFLEHTGPSHESGKRRMLPFLIDMANLFERFVAEWLEAHLPENLMLQKQENITISVEEGINFRIDIVLRDRESGKTVAVLDTKYKKSSKPSTEDIAQVVAYAEATDTTEAVLIYPSSAGTRLDTRVGRIRVRSLGYSLGQDLESAGRIFLKRLLETIGRIEPS